MLPDSAIEQRLTDLEDVLTERKQEAVKPDELRRVVVGFANSVSEGQHGILYVGVHDRTGAIVGVESPAACQKKLQRCCTDDAYPPVDHQIRVITKDGKHVVALVIPPSSKRPHFAGPAYIRDGARTIKASEQLYEELITSRHSIAGPLQRLGPEPHFLDIG